MADDVAARFAKAVEHKLNGEYSQAEPLLRAVIAEQPNNADAYHELGLVYSFLADEACLTLLERAVQLAPESIRYLTSWGKAAAMFGYNEKARPIFQRILQIDPFNDDAQNQLQFLD